MNIARQAAEALEAASVAVLIGWTQGAWARATHMDNLIVSAISRNADCFCASGALMLSAKYDRATEELAFEELFHQIGVRKHTTYAAAIAQWNDAPERTAEEVAEALWLAAQRIRSYD